MTAPVCSCLVETAWWAFLPEDITVQQGEIAACCIIFDFIHLFHVHLKPQLFDVKREVLSMLTGACQSGVLGGDGAGFRQEAEGCICMMRIGHRRQHFVINHQYLPPWRGRYFLRPIYIESKEKLGDGDRG